MRYVVLFIIIVTGCLCWFPNKLGALIEKQLDKKT